MLPSANPSAPLPTAFKAVSIGWAMLALILTWIGWSSMQSTPYFGPAWVPTVSLVSTATLIVSLLLLWMRQGWAFFVICGLTALNVILGLQLGVSLVLIAIGPALLGMLFWTLHVGGVASMWRQMFGQPHVATRGMAYGFQPAMPPAAAPAPPPAAAPQAAAPPPPRPAAPAESAAQASVLAFEQIKKLAALRDAGVLTQAEFDTKKAELLKRL